MTTFPTFGAADGAEFGAADGAAFTRHRQLEEELRHRRRVAEEGHGGPLELGRLGALCTRVVL